MKLKTALIIFLSVLIGAMLFIGYERTHAATLLSQTNADTATPNSTTLGGTAISGGTYPYFQKLGGNLSGTIATSTVSLATSGGLGSMTLGVKIQCYDDSAYTTYNSGCSSANPTRVIAQNTTKASYDFATPLTLNSTKYYALGIGCNSSCSGGTNTNLLAYGANFNGYAAGDFSTSTLNITDAYFSLSGDFGNSVSILYPATGSSGLVNFGFWRVGYTLATSQSSVLVDVFVNTTSTVSDVNYLWFDQETKPGFTGLSYDTNITRNEQLLNGGYVSSTTYYAIAKVYSSSSLLATSAVVSFSIGNATAGTQVYQAFAQPGTLVSQGGQGSQVCGKFPFSYFCDFVTIWSTLNGTSTTNSLPVLALTMRLPNNTTSSIPIISASGVTTVLGAGNVSLLRDLIKYGLWIAFGLYIYERIKHHNF